MEMNFYEAIKGNCDISYFININRSAQLLAGIESQTLYVSIT